MPKQKPSLPSRRPRMDAGALGPLVETFAEQLIALRLFSTDGSGLSDSARHFADWIYRSESHHAILMTAVEQFARHQCQCPGGRWRQRVSRMYVHRVRRFVHFLAENGVVPNARRRRQCGSYGPPDPEFLEWLRHHRGLSERTIKLRSHVLKRLLLRWLTIPRHMMQVLSGALSLTKHGGALAPVSAR